jgi:hypothetical protein
MICIGLSISWKFQNWLASQCQAVSYLYSAKVFWACLVCTQMFHVLAKQIFGCRIGGQGFGQLWQAQWTKMTKWNTTFLWSLFP